ncbi:MAG: translation initiation factor IF-2 [Bdellovibrionales bacterium]
MTETKKTDNDSGDKKDDKPKKTLSLGGTLSLKAGSGGANRPAPAPGTVAVEVRNRKRNAPAARSASGSTDANKSKTDTTLSNQEREARAKALQRAMSEDAPKKTSLPKRRTTIEDVKAEEAQNRQGSLSAREAELAELNRIEEEEKKRQAEIQENAPAVAEMPSSNAPDRRKNFSSPDAEPTSYREKMKKAAPKSPPRKLEDRRGGRMTVTQALNKDYERDRTMSMAAQKRAREKARLAAQGPKEDAKKVYREVIVPETITVGELSNRMTEPTKEIIKALMKMGVMATSSEVIDADTAELIIEEFGHTIKRVTEGDVEIGLDGIEDQEDDLVARPPVVTIMGHVDHGKTSLLDALRKTDVVAGEAGGITQHIGAYQVNTNDGIEGNTITFLDTPGHAAFTEMRARGANATDIVIIVVSAEDSVMPQTIEAINHAKAAEVPIIIAVNKIDLPDADPMKVKTELLQYEVIVEELSGDVQCVEISAKEGINLDKLEEAILIQAELLELRANPNRSASGVIIESKLEKGRGSVATALIQNGTLRIGHIFVAGTEFGKVRGLINDKGNNVKEAIPGQPVEILGINGSPKAGDPLNVVPDEAKAREVAEYRLRRAKEIQAAQAVKGRTTMDDILMQREFGEDKSLAVIIKGDVHGSVEAIQGSLDKMVEENEGIAIKVLHTGVGGITESDVTLANTTGALIIGFNVRTNTQAQALVNRDGVDVRYYNVIYDVIDDAKAILGGMLDPVEREEYIGQAKILEVFNVSKIGKVAGCEVVTGFVKRGARVRLLREDVVIHEGQLKTLQRFKDEVDEVKEGTECGMAFEKYEDIRKDDVIECFNVTEETRVVN